MTRQPLKNGMVFIVSSGRSGSKTIAHMLATVHNCESYHEPAPELIHESSAFRYGQLSGKELARLLEDSRGHRLQETLYCESNQTLSLMIPILAETFSGARFVWLTRNGRDVVGSAYAKQWYSGHSERHDSYEDCPPLERAWIDGRIEGDLCHDVSSDMWKSMDRFARCCWYWDYTNRVIERDLGELDSERIFRVKLETLDLQIKSLLTWLGLRVALPPFALRINTGIRQAYPWTEWSPEHRSAFADLCGATMDRLYPEWQRSDGEWQETQYRLRSGLIARLGQSYRLVKLANALLSPNSS